MALGSAPLGSTPLGANRRARVSGSAAYTTTAVTFDGTNDYLSRGADLTGNADGTKGTISFWINANAITGLHKIVDTQNSRVRAWLWSDGSLQVLLQDVLAATKVDLKSAAGAITTTAGWQHVVASWDTTAGTAHLYIDDAVADSTPTVSSGTIDYTDADWGIGAAVNPAGNAKIDACLADLWFSTTDYLDLSVTSNRRKFIDSSGKPVDLGSNGSTPTGTQPIIFLKGTASTFADNLGSGGAFTVTGALTDCATSPSDIVKAITDAAAGADVLGISVGLGITDSGTGADTAPGASVALGTSETATGADSVGPIAAGFALTDAGAGTDAVGAAVALTLTDTGSGLDAISVLTEAIKSIVDSGVGTDAIGALTVTAQVADIATGSDTVSVLSEALKTIADSGIGTDTVPGIQVQLQIAEAATGADTPSVSASLSVTDTAAGADSVLTSLLLAIADTATGADALTLSVLVPVTDSGTGADTTAVTAVLQILDTAGATDVVLAFDSATRITTITFTLAPRQITFGTLAPRSMTFGAIQPRTMTFTLH